MAGQQGGEQDFSGAYDIQLVEIVTGTHIYLIVKNSPDCLLLIMCTLC